MKYNGKQIQVVWVDLDDTLIDFHANSRVALRELYAREGLDRLWPSAEQWIHCYEKHNKALWAEYNVSRITRDFLMMERFSRPLEEAGIDSASAHTESPRLSDIYLDLLARGRLTEPGAAALLEMLRGAGVTVGVLSNGFKEVQHRKIRSAGLDGLIDITVLSDDIGIPKPDVRLYRHAMERSGVTDPSAHLMIGDNPSTDLEGALGAGWGAIGYFKEQTKPVEHGERYVSVNSLGLVEELLRAD